VLDGRGSTAEVIRIYKKTKQLKTIRRPLHDSNPFVVSDVRWHVPIRSTVFCASRSTRRTPRETTARAAGPGSSSAESDSGFGAVPRGKANRGYPRPTTKRSAR
jgi:hypothetical protein